jgi:hypothetical protein
MAKKKEKIKDKFNKKNMKEIVRIGNAGGFWGDDLHALRRQLEGGSLDYISSDYLAEITMSILRKQQLKNPDLGYVTDFIEQIVDVADLLVKKNVTMIANAGGINPLACARRVIKELKGKTKLRIAVIEGDNIIEMMDEFYPAKADFKNMENDEKFELIKDRIQSANAYLGIPPIVKALESGANLVIAGRVTDTSITMAPLVYEFGWKSNDWDKLASALVAGHIIECGAQATGGNFTDWHKVKRWDNFGYPIVEVYPDATFFVTKHKNTGGLVSVETVKEQLVYEMGDPAYYISPDVIADFLSIQLEDAGENRVRVFGIQGSPSTHFLKVSMAFEDGYKASSSIILSGPNAIDKARVYKNLFWKRLGIQFEKSNTEYVGYDSCHKNLAPDVEPNEVLLQFSVFDYDPEKVSEFSKSIAPLILSGPPGVAVTGGRPKLHNVMTYWPTLVRKELVPSTVHVLDENGDIASTFEISSVTGYEEVMNIQRSNKQVSKADPTGTIIVIGDEETERIKLRELCLARSGDKGDTANIGLVARSKTIYLFLRQYLTADIVKSMFAEACEGRVIRYELDNLLALNFLLEKSLDGGGTKSLQIDAQGKTYAQALLNHKISVPKRILDTLLNEH